MSAALRAARNDSIYVDLIAAAVAVAVLVASAHGYSGFLKHIGAIRGALYQLEALIVAAILGFLIAATAILGVATAVQRLRVERYGIYKLLIASFVSSMTISTVSIVYFVVAFIADQDEKSPNALFSLIGFALFLAVMLRIARSVRRLYQTLSI